MLSKEFAIFTKKDMFTVISEPNTSLEFLEKVPILSYGKYRLLYLITENFQFKHLSHGGDKQLRLKML